MKVILLFDEGSKVVGELLPAHPRKQRETQEKYEQRFCALFNESQPNAVHKVVGCHILRN
jgi:hypothetical protein